MPTPIVQLPFYYEVFEVVLLLFIIAVFAVYRSKIFNALKEIAYDILFALVFTGASMAILNVRNNNYVAYLFLISLIVIFAARIIYHKFYKSSGQPPPQLSQF